jgi:hypothetical protein
MADGDVESKQAAVDALFPPGIRQHAEPSKENPIHGVVAGLLPLMDAEARRWIPKGNVSAAPAHLFQCNAGAIANRRARPVSRPVRGIISRRRYLRMSSRQGGND